MALTTAENSSSSNLSSSLSTPSEFVGGDTPIPQSKTFAAPASYFPGLLGQPFAQPYYAFSPETGWWSPRTPSTADGAQLPPRQDVNSGNVPNITRLALYSWNIDFTLPNASERMSRAISHLESELEPYLPSSAPSTTTATTATAATATAATAATATTNDAATAVVIFLQECTREDLVTLGRHPWVRSLFRLTEECDVGEGFHDWGASYGTTALIDCRLPITSCFRVPFGGVPLGPGPPPGPGLSDMGRDGLFVDIAIPTSSSPPPSSAWRRKRQRRACNQNATQTMSSHAGVAANDQVSERTTIRLCNTHLESLRHNPPRRPPQVALLASYLRGEKQPPQPLPPRPTIPGTNMDDNSGENSSNNSDSGEQPGVPQHQPIPTASAPARIAEIPDAALVAGDFNAIQPSDLGLHLDHGMRDAYLESGGREGAEEGMTWGPQATTVERKRFGGTRMDKVWFRNNYQVEGQEEEEEEAEPRDKEPKQQPDAAAEQEQLLQEEQQEGPIQLRSFAHFGAGVELEPASEYEETFAAKGFERPWITDHIGVFAIFDVV